MLTPSNIPAHLLPLPEGRVLLGQGGHIPNASSRISGYAINLNIQHDGYDEWREVDAFDAEDDDNLCYAVPMDHPLVDANRELVESLNPSVVFPWMDAPAAPTFVPQQPLPEELPPVPEGCVLLGWGSDAIGHYDGSGFILRGIRRSERGQTIHWQSGSWSTTDHNYCFAYPSASAIARRNPDVVAYYQQLLSTQGATPPITPTPSFRPLPPDHPMASAGSTPAPVGAIPLESWMPSLPPGAVYLGRGGSFRRERNFEGWAISEDGRGWRGGTNWSGRDPENYYATPADSDVARLNASPAPAVVDASPPPYGKRLWILTLNGAPVASLEELRVLCGPLIFKPENLDAVTDCLWRALEYDDPEGRLGDWATKEPVLLMVDFLPDRRGDDALIPTVVESSKTIGEIITTAAAGVLLRGGLSNHFHYTEEGRLVINPESPPSIDQGCEILRRTLEVRETGQKLDNYSAWTLGMLGDELERFFGDAFDPSLVMEATGRAYNTYITSLKVYRELWANRRNLSFTHHKEALYAKVEPSDTEFILDTADKLRLSVAEQRKLTSFVRLYGSQSLKDDPPDDSHLLMERLEVKSVNKNYLFFLRSENKWFKYRGPFEHIPNGATTIINADTRAMLDSEGKPTELSEWTPVGVEMPYVRGHAATLEANRAEALPGDDEVEPSHGGNTDSRTSSDDSAPLIREDEGFFHFEDAYAEIASTQEEPERRPARRRHALPGISPDPL